MQLQQKSWLCKQFTKIHVLQYTQVVNTKVNCKYLIFVSRNSYYLMKQLLFINSQRNLQFCCVWVSLLWSNTFCCYSQTHPAVILNLHRVTIYPTYCLIHYNYYFLHTTINTMGFWQMTFQFSCILLHVSHIAASWFKMSSKGNYFKALHISKQYKKCTAAIRPAIDRH